MSGYLARQSEARQHVRRAEASLEAADLDAARQQIGDALRLDPSSLTARVLEARIALAASRPTDALRAVESAGLCHPDKQRCPQLSMLRAEALIRAGDLQHAADELSRLVCTFPHDLRPRRMLAQVCVRTGRRDEAIEHLTELKRLSPNDQAAAAMLAELLESSRPQDSVDLLSRCAAESDHEADHLRVAQLCRKLERESDAEATYRDLLHRRPNDRDLWLEAGRVADAVGASDLAIERLTRAAALSRRGDGGALRELAIAYLHRADWNRAGRCWHNAARCGDGDVMDWAGLLICALMTGRESLARRADERLSLHLSPVERRHMLASLWQHAASGDAVRRTAGEVEERPMQAAGVLDQLLERSEASLQCQSAQHPHRADAHYHLAMCLHAGGDNDAAHDAVQTAVAINPRYVAARELAERVTPRG